MNRGRRIAFDYGDVRIGVAVSDPEAILASPVSNLQSQSSDLISELRELIEEYQPIYFAIGSPSHLNGNPSAKGESVKEFCTLVRSLSELPIYLIDERLTTVSAARSLQSAGINTKAAKEKIDGAAAVAILESAMASEKLSGAPSKVLFP